LGLAGGVPKLPFKAIETVYRKGLPQVVPASRSWVPGVGLVRVLNIGTLRMQRL
jgi:hypothetical protein